MRRTASLSLLAVSLLLTACSGVPTFDAAGVGRFATKPDGRTDDKILPADIANHIKCELYYAVKPDAAHASSLSDDEKKALIEYDVAVLMNLKVDDNGGSSPSLIFIDPYATMSQSFSFAFSGQLNQTRERTFATAFVVHMSRVDANECPSTGAVSLNGINLLGDLGLAEVADFGLKLAGSSPALQPIAMGSAGGYAPSTASGTAPVFGSSLQFTLTKSLGLGPTWTFAQFKGPTGSGGGGGGGAGGGSGGSGGSGSSSGSGGQNQLLNFGRTDTHQLWIAFAPSASGNLQTAAAIKSQSRAVALAQDKVKQELAMVDQLKSLPAPKSRNQLVQPFRQFNQAEALSRAQQAVTDAKNAQETEQRKLDDLQEQRDREASQPNTGVAQGVINTMILQNLTTVGPIS